MQPWAVLEEGVAAFEQAAILGSGWEEAMALVARGAGGHGATLPRTDADGVSISILSTVSTGEAVSAYVGGKAPPDSREGRVVVGPDQGFCLDHDHYGEDELRRDPFYQEFLRPHGFGWHAAAWLASDGFGDLCLSLKRHHRDGPFLPEERAALNRVLPRLRQAATVGRQLVLAASPAGAGQAVLHLAFDGRVAAAPHGADLLADWGLRLRAGRLVGPAGNDQERLDAAVREATRRDGRPCAVVLWLPRSHRRLVVRFAPLRDMARQVFGGVAAFALCREILPRPEPDPALEPVLRAFALTPAEARVALLLAAGWPPDAIARRLAVSPGTVRNQIKLVLAKTGTARQAEFVALAAALLR